MPAEETVADLAQGQQACSRGNFDKLRAALLDGSIKKMIL